jgi:hypothetical protein
VSIVYLIAAVITSSPMSGTASFPAFAAYGGEDSYGVIAATVFNF